MKTSNQSIKTGESELPSKVNFYKMKSSNLFLLVVISLTLCCCSTDELSRTKAELLLIKNIKYPRDLPLKICTTRVAVSTDMAYAHKVVFFQTYYEALEKEGVLTYDTTRIADPSIIVFQAYFTDKGQPYVVGETKVDHNPTENEYFQVKTGSFVFGEITDIIQWKELKMAKANFTERANLSSFGKNTGIAKVYYRNAFFKKYDDGWRLFYLNENEVEKMEREKRSSLIEENIPPDITKIENDTFYIVEVVTGYNFDSLYKVSLDVATFLHSRVDMLGRIYKPHKGIVLPDDSDEELYRGEYILRRPFEDQNFVSIEMHMAYEEGGYNWKSRDTLLMCVVANILDKKSAADSVVDLLKGKIKTVQAIKRRINLDCIH